MTTRQRRGDRWAMSRVLDLLVSLYPAGFRRDYGYAIAQLIRDQRRDLGAVSFPRTVVFWARVVLDLVRTVWVEHASLLRERGVPKHRRVWLVRLQVSLGLVLVATSAGNTVFDLLSPKLHMGIAAGLLTLTAACSGTALIVRARRAADSR